MALSRRRFLCGCGGSLLLSGLPGPAAAQAGGTDAAPAGCLLAANIGGAPGCGTAGSTGSAQLDADFRQEFEQQRGFFALPRVGWQFLDDCNGKNAYAAPDPPVIWFGINFARELYSTYASTLPLWQVLAHEFGHQMQFAHGRAYANQPTAMLSELEADMFSGFYLGGAKSGNPLPEIQTVLPVAFAGGDKQYNDPRHHGTPEQRVAAVIHGAVVAYEYYSGAIEKSVQAVRERFARSLPL